MRLGGLAKKTVLALAAPVLFSALHEYGFHQRLGEKQILYQKQNEISQGFAAHDYVASHHFGPILVKEGDSASFRNAKFAWYNGRLTHMVTVNVDKLGKCDAEIPSRYVIFPGRTDLKPLISKRSNPLQELSKNVFDSLHNWSDDREKIIELMGLNDFGRGSSEFANFLMDELYRSSRLEDKSKGSRLRERVLTAFACIGDEKMVPGLVRYAEHNPDHAREVAGYLRLFKTAHPYILEIAKCTPGSSFSRDMLVAFGDLDFFINEFDSYPERSSEYLCQLSVEKNEWRIYSRLLKKILYSKDSCDKVAPRIKALENYACQRRIRAEFYHPCRQ